MTDQSQISEKANLKDIPSAISSPGWGGGPQPSNLPNGNQLDLFGREAVPVSHLAHPDSKKEPQTRGTSGQHGSASSRSIALQLSLESKLQRQLERIGSTECIMTWKERVTPLGRRYCQHVPSMRPIGEIDFGLWRTPTASGLGQDTAATARGKSVNLAGQAMAAVWPTPKATDGSKGTRTYQGALIEVQRNKGPDLPSVATVSMWPTPVAHEARLGYQHRHEDAKGSQKSLTTEAVDALGLGANVNGSLEGTEKRGGLNPAFPCWLMGYREEWLCSMQLAMQLIRMSPRNSSKRVPKDV